MHTWWIRLNAVTFFSLTLLLLASLLSAITSPLSNNGVTQTPIVKVLGLSPIGDPMVTKKRERSNLPALGHPGLLSLKKMGGVDRSHLVLEIDVDLTPLYHWNVWQVFCYVTACYETTEYQSSCVVVWDKIVPSKAQIGMSEWLGVGEADADLSQPSSSKKSKKGGKKSKKFDPRATESQSPDPYILKIPATLNTGYPIVDPSASGLRGVDIKLHFNWDIMPMTGGIYGGGMEEGGEWGFKMYDDYTR
jgi:hypothetical protein